MKKYPFVIFTVSLSLLISGCYHNDDKKKENQEKLRPDNLIEQLKKEKQDITEKARKQLDNIDLETLEEDLTEPLKDAGSDINEALEKLKQQRKELLKSLEDSHNMSKKEWKKFQKKLDKDLRNLQKEYEELKKQKDVNAKKI
jgi:tRNA A37 threonylcarbamoyladenosine modification protein TsaB